MQEKLTVLQEFANPVTREILHLYPEEGVGPELKHPRQARKWAKEVDPAVAAPMARGIDGRDYFVNELAMARVGSQRHPAPVVIARWFQREGALFSKAYPVGFRETNMSEGPEMIVDTREAHRLEIPLSEYMFCIEDLCQPSVQQQWAIPSPERLCGMLQVFLSISRSSC